MRFLLLVWLAVQATQSVAQKKVDGPPLSATQILPLPLTSIRMGRQIIPPPPPGYGGKIIYDASETTQAPVAVKPRLITITQIDSWSTIQV